MTEDNVTATGDLLVEGNLEFFGMITGRATVAPGGMLVLRGLCRADLIVSREASAIVRGVVMGDILNSGMVELHGTVQGNVHTLDGQFNVIPGGAVGGSIER